MHNAYTHNVYEGWLKSSLADLDSLIQCDQMRFIFQHSSHCSPHTFPSVLQCLDHIGQKVKNSRFDI